MIFPNAVTLCKALGPLVEDLSIQYNDCLDFAKFNIDDNPITPGKYGIKAIPTIAIFKNGRPMEMITGLRVTAKNNCTGLRRIAPDIGS